MAVRSSRPRAGISGRVALAVISLFVTVFTITGVTLYSISRANVERAAQGQLTAAAEDLNTLASEGVDPLTGKPFSSASAVLAAAVDRTPMDPHQGALGFVEGELTYRAPAAVSMRLENDGAFMTAIAPYVGGDLIVLQSLKTDEHDLRYIIIPIAFPDGSSGTLVRAIDMAPQLAELDGTFKNYALVGLGSIALVGAVIVLLMGSLLAPLKLVHKTAEHLTANDLSGRIPVVGKDALTDLTVTINAMLDRLETAVSTQRQLTNDVSHELRTPLTIMRGNLDLMDPTKPEQVAVTKKTLLNVTDRMERLVDDLLTLAFVDQPDFLRIEPTEIDVVTTDVLELAESLDRRPWLVDNLADVSAEVDPYRLQQAWLQLAQNAVKYSYPGTPITIGSSVSDGEIHCYVIDQGQGISPEDQERIMKRFVRTESARMSDTNGSGLGLAIVNSIAQAHGGYVQIVSQLGVGSRFTISIPLRSMNHEQHSDS